MNVALRKPMTLAEFLAWEERQELRYEFDGFAPVAMTGGTFAHAAIQMNLYRTLGNRLLGKPCRPIGSHLKILVAGRIRYPDAFVVCSPVTNKATVVTDPVVVFEVLSPSTANEDLFTKNAEYRATPSIQRYVVLQQTHIGALVFSRDGDRWIDELLVGAEAILRMPEIGIEIPLSEIYADLSFDESDETADAEEA
jgi:Uma2 family endonuclease